VKLLSKHSYSINNNILVSIVSKTYLLRVLSGTNPIPRDSLSGDTSCVPALCMIDARLEENMITASAGNVDNIYLLNINILISSITSN